MFFQVRGRTIMLSRIVASEHGLAHGTRGPLNRIGHGPEGMGSFPRRHSRGGCRCLWILAYKGHSEWVPIFEVVRFRTVISMWRWQFPVLGGFAFTKTQAQVQTLSLASKYGLPFEEILVPFDCAFPLDYESHLIDKYRASV